MPAPQLPPLPAAPPATQPAWQAVVNAFSQWRQILQASRWTAPTLQNGWENYGSGYTPAGYYIDLTGRVWLRGMLNGSSASLNTTIFTLPVGPSYQQLFQVWTSSGALRLDVGANGTVVLDLGGSGAAPGWVSLDGLSFSLSP